MKSGEVWTGRNTTVSCTELWNDNGQQVGTPFKSSKFGKAFGYEALQKEVCRFH